MGMYPWTAPLSLPWYMYVCRQFPFPAMKLSLEFSTGPPSSLGTLSRFQHARRKTKQHAAETNTAQTVGRVWNIIMGGTKKKNKNLSREIVWMGGWMDVVSLVAFLLRPLFSSFPLSVREPYFRQCSSETAAGTGSARPSPPNHTDVLPQVKAAD